MKPLFYLILAAGFGNTVLRPEMENPLTLYRILAPLGLMATFLIRPLYTTAMLACFGVFFAYNYVLATLYSPDFSQFYVSIMHYLFIFILLIMMIHLKTALGRGFEDSFLKFLAGFYAFLLLNLLVELAVGPYWPNLYEDETDEKILRAFFWNQNDLAVVLCIIGWFALCLDRYRGTARWTVVGLTVGILFYNDSKSALLSFLLLSVPIYLLFRARERTRLGADVWVFLGACLFVLAVVGIVSVSEVKIQFANARYSMGDLLIKPVLKIVQLQPSGEEWGSLNNRTDAAIFVMIEYLNSWGRGLGAGGSWLVLTMPQYLLGGAASPHNALLQFTADFGYPVLLGYMYAMGWALRNLFRRGLAEHGRLKVMAILSFPLLGLSQSGAIVTNYFFWSTVFYIWMLDRRPPLAGLPEARAGRAGVAPARAFAGAGARGAAA